MPNLSQRIPNPKYQWQGRVNHAQGACFERLIDKSCEYYRQIGTAVIEKTPEPFHIIKSLGRGIFQGNFAKAAQPDFKGVLKGGQMIAFEAKNSASEEIKQSRVTKDQTKALDAYEKAGALCFVLVSVKMQYFALVPWNVWKSMKDTYGRKYMTLNELLKYEKKFTGNVINFLNIRRVK